jgi:glycosyl transferase family 2
MKVVVVVPTRNRADLATTSVASALGDRDTRVSVLVSDNSTDPEQVERLRKWCEEKADERLRYVRPHEPLPMSPHWQWALERALESPATTHVMYLTDRLVMRPGALGELLTLAERHPDDVLTFGDDTIVDYRQPVTISERPWTGKLLRIDSAQLLRVLARGILLGAPTMLNTIAPRRVLEDIADTYGSVFASIAPDHCFSYRCLDRVDSILHWDRVVIVQRALWRSNGFSQIRGVSNADHVDFLRELGESRINQHAPVPELLTVTNAIYNEYEFVRSERPSSKLSPLRRHYYLGANARDVARLEDPDLRARMHRVLSEHGWSNRTRLRYALGLSLSAAGYYWRRPHTVLRRLLRRPATSPQFGDSAEALAYALEHPSVARTKPDHLWPLMSRPGAAREIRADVQS